MMPRKLCQAKVIGMKIETAASLLGVVMEALLHRRTCCKAAQGGDLPVDLMAEAMAILDAAGRDTSGTREWLSTHGVHLPKADRPSYQRRANNQKSAEVEEFIRELLGRGLSKTAIAKQLSINRRVVIRVSREAVQSA
jgi:hypothetical protein